MGSVGQLIVYRLRILTGQGMNASMNDTHNLGRLHSECDIIHGNLCLHSLETCTCAPRMGRHLPSEDSKLL